MGYFASQFFDGYRLLNNVAFTVEDGRITSVTPDAEPGQHDVLDGLIMPAMVDVQVNGGGGVQFACSERERERERRGSAYVRSHGTGPTMSPPSVVKMKQRRQSRVRSDSTVH